MNKYFYRIVSSEILVGFRFPLLEGNHASPLACSTHPVASARRSPLRWWLAAVQVAILPFASAQIVADPIAPDYHRPTVLETYTGVPLINIQTPSAAGVSRNLYHQFDVDQRGAILNNAPRHTQTELGGPVQGNPSLAAGSARIILNEINSNDPSLLRGYVEVAGDRAQIVIANPAGITCDGCGFINANRATMTTGLPVLEGTSLAHYRVQGGVIRVNGQGLDARGADHTDLIARAVQVNAGIWARRLAVTTGTNTISADPIHVDKADSSGNVPAFALDVGALGGMYAQKIMLVGTEHGVGVRHAGTMGAQAGELIVKIDGRLELIGGSMTAPHMFIQAESMLIQGGTIEQTGSRDLALQAGRVHNHHAGQIGRTATTAYKPEAIYAASGLQTPLSGRLTITHLLENDNGRILAGGDIDLTAWSGLSNDNGYMALRSLSVDGPFSNRDGRLNVATDARIQANQFDNERGWIYVSGALGIKAQNLSNRGGEIMATGDEGASIVVDNLFDNTSGKLFVADKMTLRAANLENREGIIQRVGEEALDSPTDIVIASANSTCPVDEKRGVASVEAVIPAGNGGRPLDINEEITPAGNGYRYLVYAVTWQPSFCKLKPESPGCDQPPQKFLTHGIWPYNDSTDQKTNRHPAFCNSAPGCTPGTACELSEATLDKIAHDPRIVELVPPNPQGMFRHEWKKHGTCSGKTEEDYFNDIVKLRQLVDYDETAFNAWIGASVTFDELKAAFPSNTAFRCFVQDGKQYLHEVFYLTDAAGAAYQKETKLQIGIPCQSQETFVPSGV